MRSWPRRSRQPAPRSLRCVGESAGQPRSRAARSCLQAPSSNAGPSSRPVTSPRTTRSTRSDRSEPGSTTVLDVATREDLFAEASLAQAEGAGRRPAEQVPILRVRPGDVVPTSGLVAGEEPLEIRLDGRSVAVT